MESLGAVAGETICGCAHTDVALPTKTALEGTALLFCCLYFLNSCSFLMTTPLSPNSLSLVNEQETKELNR